MSVCEHFSQRATCPPRAAVRQLSMADITFTWPRLTWPALALRHAAPWSRKISATSSAGRRTRHAGARRGTSRHIRKIPATGVSSAEFENYEQRRTKREVGMDT
jgi:hypothetical protein